MPPPFQPPQQYNQQQQPPITSASPDVRLDRSVRPLGSALRPGRSRTPTPANPRPGPGGGGSGGSGSHSSSNSSMESNRMQFASPTSFNSAQGGGATKKSSASPISADQTLDSLESQQQTQRGPSSTSSASVSRGLNRSRSSQSQAERRPWFPYPSPTSNTNNRSSSTSNNRQAPTSASARRISTISTDSTSSASSYNSEDIGGASRIDRRAQSVDPEQSTLAASRGRPWRNSTSKSSAMATAGNPSEDGEDKGGSRAAGIDDHDSSSSDDEKERAHFKSVLKAFDAYLSHTLAANNARRKSFYALPRSHRLLLSSLGSALPGPLLSAADKTEDDEKSTLLAAGRGFKARLDEIDDRIRRNYDVLEQILDDSRGFLGDDEEAVELEGDHAREASKVTSREEEAERGTDRTDVDSGGNATQKPSGDPPSALDVQDDGHRSGENSGSGSSQMTAKARPVRPRVPNHDLDKVRSTIKQFVRDWSVEGFSEREAAYDPILEALESVFKHISSAQRTQLRVLVPGAGLGRLAFEIAWLGFSCQGNEFSFYMLLASHFILNKTTKIKQHVLYPFIHSSSNWRSADDMLRPIQIPDINPSDLPSHVDFSMVAGEFIEVYSKPQEKEAWNAVATCFFIDTAHNLTRYLEVINQILVNNGVWINVGPLLWHYEGAANGDLSIELTLDEVLNLVELMGFHIESQRTLAPQCYTGNQDSMLTYQYSPEFWIARKIRSVTPAKVV